MGEFKVARHQHLHTVTIKADELAQEGNRQKALPILPFLLKISGSTERVMSSPLLAS